MACSNLPVLPIEDLMFRIRNTCLMIQETPTLLYRLFYTQQKVIFSISSNSLKIYYDVAKLSSYHLRNIIYNIHTSIEI